MKEGHGGRPTETPRAYGADVFKEGPQVDDFGKNPVHTPCT